MKKVLLITLFGLLSLTIIGCVSDGVTPPKNYPYPELTKRHPPRYRLIFGSPFRLRLVNSAPKGPYGFRIGWIDGCQTMTAAFAKNFYKSLYDARKDYVFAAKDPDYSVGYTFGYWYCSRYHEVSQMRGEERYGGFR